MCTLVKNCRLRRAIINKELFRVIVIIPVYPAGSLLSVATRYVIKYIYKTINREEHSLWEKLQTEFPDVDVSQYLTFHCLRNYAFLNHVTPEGTSTVKPVTEQIYVHAKLMIVDDRLVICGSANINDRSMTGNGLCPAFGLTFLVRRS